MRRAPPARGDEAGIVTLGVVPLWVKGRLGPRVAVFTVVLLAISPLQADRTTRRMHAKASKGMCLVCATVCDLGAGGITTAVAG